MTCFFDASHGPGRHEIAWSPQWGAPRPVWACPACAQRWADHLQGRDGYSQHGYPQPGYPQPGYPQPGYGHQERHGYGAGSVVAAGAAGFVGGMIANEMFDHEHVVEHVDVIEEVEVIEEVSDDYGNYGNEW